MEITTTLSTLKNKLFATKIGHLIKNITTIAHLATRPILNPLTHTAGKMDYLSVIEEYPKIKEHATEMLTSLVGDIAKLETITDRNKRKLALSYIAREGAFIDLLFTLDKDGNLLDNDGEVDTSHPDVSIVGPYIVPKSSPRAKVILGNLGAEKDIGDSYNHNRRHRRYFRESLSAALPVEPGTVVVTPPYTSVCTKAPCVSAVLPLPNRHDSNRKILVVDADVAALIEFFRGEHRVRTFEQVYTWGMWVFLFSLTLIGVGLFIGGVFDFLLAILDLLTQMFYLPFHENASFNASKLLNVLVTITVVIAIADLVKTLFEEEIILYKDINRPSPARRTVIRFTTAILIALSIETLVLVFKQSSDKKIDHPDPSSAIDPIHMLYGVTALLIGLAIFTVLTGWLEQRKNEATANLQRVARADLAQAESQGLDEREGRGEEDSRTTSRT